MPRIIREHFTKHGKPKKTFETPEHARDHVNKYHMGRGLVIYKCGFCNNYHLATDWRDPHVHKGAFDGT